MSKRAVSAWRTLRVAPGEMTPATWTDRPRHGALTGNLPRIPNSEVMGQSTPANPRWRFAPYSALYKLYVVCPTPTTDGAFRDDPRARFVQQLLPELQRALFGDT